MQLKVELSNILGRRGCEIVRKVLQYPQIPVSIKTNNILATIANLIFQATQ